MNSKILNTIIPAVSLVIFFVWGWIEGTYQHSWIIFMISGPLMAVLANMNKNKEKEAGKAKDKDDTENK